MKFYYHATNLNSPTGITWRHIWKPSITKLFQILTISLGSYFYNREVDAKKGTTEYMWPGEDRSVSFFAYAPFDNANVSISGEDTAGRPVYSLTVPEDVKAQPDFITAEVLDMRGGNCRF